MCRILAAVFLLLSTAADAAQRALRAFITEFATYQPAAPAPMASLPALVHQAPLALGAVAVTSATFNSSTRYIRIVCEVQCSVRLGAGASINDMLLPAGRPEYFGVGGGARSISVIGNP